MASKIKGLFLKIIVYLVIAGLRWWSPSNPIENNGMSVSQILFENKVSDEIKRQLLLLQYGSSGVCKWKESTYCSGLPNIAAVELGASIASTYDTVPYGSSFCDHKNYNTLCDKSCPQTILKHDVVPGRNFNFVKIGRVLIKLGGPAIISGFTLHHPSKDMLPNGFLSSAPKDFQVRGYYCEDSKEFLFGNYQYRLNSSPAQAFPIQNYLNESVSLIEVTFVENHGNPKYTAVYRFEVHGDVK